MIINLNQPCNVILTAHGAEVYNEYFRELHVTCKQIELTHLKAEDELSLQLWELMSVFGKHLYNGAENCFANNDISFNDKIVKIPERSSREEIKELLDSWKGTIVACGDISISSPWISVEERLPEEHTNVIVTDGRNVAHCKKYGDGFYTNIGKCCNVTHWMPIPELPKEEKK